MRKGLRELRLEKGLGQAELALLSGVGVFHLCRVEGGLVPLTPALAARIAPVFGVDPVELAEAQGRVREARRRALARRIGVGVGAVGAA